MGYLMARVKRWWHCLGGMFHGHRYFDVTLTMTDGSKYRVVECTCGERFYPPERAQ